MNPPSRPASGDSTSALSARVTPRDVTSSPSAAPGPTLSNTSWHQAAPTMPPMRACDELDGMP